MHSIGGKQVLDVSDGGVRMDVIWSLHVEKTNNTQ